MQRTFNLQKTIRKAFYEDSRGYMTQQSRAWMNCYKCKSDEGIKPQEAWQKCRDEFQSSSQKADWALKYVATKEEGSKPYDNAKTPATKKILKEKA